uniref:Uncharacterized protein n=1 Tax=Zea mays TaxID=4577 RepID=C0PBW5_MAIZE|nr:unknown [Zea mays]
MDIYNTTPYISEALEARWDAPAAVVDEEAEVDGQVEVDAQDVGPEDGAEAHRRLQVRQPLDQRAARRPGRRPQGRVDQPVQQVGAHAQLQRVHGATTARPTAAAAATTRSSSASTTAAARRGWRRTPRSRRSAAWRSTRRRRRCGTRRCRRPSLFAGSLRACVRGGEGVREEGGGGFGTTYCTQHSGS